MLNPIFISGAEASLNSQWKYWHFVNKELLMQNGLHMMLPENKEQ